MAETTQNQIPEVDTFSVLNSSYQKYTQDSGFIERFFWRCAGVPIFVLQIKPTEHTKYFCIGVAVFTTAIAAFLSGSFAMYQAFEGKPMALGIAVGIGFLWALMIFNLDRFIVQSMRSEVTTKNKILTAAPRLILAVLIGLSVSKPLEIQFFEKEINEYLLSEDKAKANKFYITEFENSTNFANKRIPELRVLTEQSWIIRENSRLERDYESEGLVTKKSTNATIGSGVVGKGINWKQKNDEFIKQDNAYKALKNKNDNEIEKLQSNINAVVKDRDTIIKSKMDEYKKSQGFLAMLDGFGKLAENSDTIYKVNWAVILIFVFIECAPILVKVMTKSGPFDYALLTIEESEKYAEEINKQLFQEISQNFKKIKIEQHKHWILHEERAFTDTLIATEITNKAKRDVLLNMASSTVLDKTFSNIVNSVQSDFAKVSIVGNTNTPEVIGYGARAVKFIKGNVPAIGIGALGLYFLQLIDVGTKIITFAEKVWSIFRPFFAFLLV